MKAIVYDGQGIRYQDAQDPQLADQNGAIIKVTHCSICGSDLHMYHGANMASEDTGFCVGHETIGEVVEVGRDARRVKVGDQVMLSGLISTPCGHCANCKAKKPFFCHRQKINIYGNNLLLNGGQAEAIAVPDADTNAALIPEGISKEQALLLTDTLPTAYFGCENADIKPGSIVAVIGLGPIGLMAVELAFVMGASQVFAIDPVQHRRSLAEKLGATAITPEQALEIITEETDAAMASAVIDAAGIDATLQLAFEVVSNWGVVSCVGINHKPTFEFPQMLAMMKSVTFRSALAYVPMKWPNLIPLLQSGRIKPERVFSHQLPLSEGENAYKMFADKTDDAVKIILSP